MIEKITGLDKNQLFLNNYKLTKLQQTELEKLKKRFQNGEPIEYIIQKAEFFGLDFYVDSRVLIPRNDTEILVSETIKEIKKNNKEKILIDIGTGSVCIPISIIKILLTEGFSPLKKTYIIDISKDALDVAKINVKKYNLEDKIELIQGDLLEKFELNTNILCPNGHLNLENLIITANLPYIKNGDYKNMDNSTIKFEPDLALYGGEKTGFELYEKLIYQIFELQSIYNIKSLILFIEIGFDQKEVAIKFLEKQNLQFEIFKDNGGVDRCVKIYF